MARRLSSQKKTKKKTKLNLNKNQLEHIARNAACIFLVKQSAFQQMYTLHKRFNQFVRVCHAYFQPEEKTRSKQTCSVFDILQRVTLFITSNNAFTIRTFSSDKLIKKFLTSLLFHYLIHADLYAQKGCSLPFTKANSSICLHKIGLILFRFRNNL